MSRRFHDRAHHGAHTSDKWRESQSQVILNLKSQVAGLNQQIEVLSKLLGVKHEDINIDDVQGQWKWTAIEVINNDHLKMILVRSENYEFRERLINQAFDTSVTIVEVEQFMEHHEAGQRGGQVGAQKFKDRYDDYDVLVIENLEQLASNRAKLQEELFDRVYARSHAGKLTVLSGNAAFIIGGESEEYLQMLSLGKNIFVG